MDIVTVSRRDHVSKKENKENTQPAFGGKAVIKREKALAPPFQLKSNTRKETSVRNGPLKPKEKQAELKSTTAEALKKTVQRNKKGAAVSDVKPRQTHSQAFLSEQAVKHRKMVVEAPKPPAAGPSSKPAPGMYKGKIVQSKIGSIWKSSNSITDTDSKPSAPKPESQRVGHMMKSRSKSVVDQPRNITQKPAPTRSKSASERLQVSKPPVTSRPPAGFRSARPPARTVTATLTSTGTRNTKAAPIKGGPISKPKVAVTDVKVNKPPPMSTISQYRLNMETAEERRAKLADWLASKGKTFKRPAMTAAQSKTKVSVKPKAEPKPQSQFKPQQVNQHSTDPKPSLDDERPDAAAALCADTQRAEVTEQIQTPVIMNTTLDLLENSDEDLFGGQQERVDDIVVNLCDALEAMGTPSQCSEGVSLVSNVCSEVEESEPMYGCEEEELKNEKPEDVSEQMKIEQLKDEEDSEESEAEMDDTEKAAGVMETTPQREDASVVKYSVKTTPYLQSVKKTIEGEVSTSKRKSNIKDLKFLTPVRRSSRIERKSSRLPTMLVDHDPCVTSLAELVKLDDDQNAYIYRKNPALLEELPDQPRV